jgi:DNA processing protein
MNSQSNLSKEEVMASLRLIRSDNIGIKTFYNLIKYYGSALATIKKISELPSLNVKTRKIILASEEDIQQELENVEKIGAQFLHHQDQDYPYLLKLTADPPPFLTIIGKKELLQRDTVAIVGSRNASTNGLNFTHKIATELSQANLVIVSGLARGIDTAAHKSSLTNGTIAVIAGGIDNIYPLENKKLFEEIADNGLIIAENSYGTTPTAKNFPQRNRIISGLCMGTAVMEANLKSGSLITARFAAEQGRNVFAVPGFPLDYRYSGTNYLLKQGAILIESAEDILEHLKYNRSKQLDLLYTETTDKELPEETCEVKQDIDQIQDLILSSIGFSPTTIDDLMIRHNLSVDIIQIAILELELEGKVIKSNNTITLMS